MKQRHIDLLAWVLLAAFVAFSVVYHRVLMPVSPLDMDPEEFDRGIGSPLLLGLNGHLGVFLNLRYMGPAVTLALPACVVALWRWRRLERWQLGSLAFVLLAVSVIGAFGGFNYRYAFSLQPVLTVAVVGIAWAVLSPGARRPFLAGLTVATVLNTALALEHRQRVHDATPGHTSPDTMEGSLEERLDTGPRDLEAWLLAQGVRPTDTVLVNNLPIWYYVTARPGIYYWCGSDQLLQAHGKPFLFRDRSDAQVFHYLLDSLHCRYVFSTEEYDRFAPRYRAFLEAWSDRVVDERGHVLHRLRDTLRR
ncbi:MAG: hypothetical protein IPJ87_06075 [Flavobacteriales bacterium]|jgi:hypothetical protein|nr:hypothetical protein [Flavobacteriales bacterium]MBK7941426.1 hypothetical protein [Flavobacteriales bacterium]MBK9701474.1 hypothetical protein [Flavobacteriales bacterium]